MRGMTGHTQGRFLMYARYAVQDSSAPRRVGVPGIAGCKHVIDGRADRDMRVLVGRGIVFSGPQLVFWMVGADGDVVSTLRGESARREFVSGQCLYFVRQRDRVLSFEIFLERTVCHSIDRYVGWNLIALH